MPATTPNGAPYPLPTDPNDVPAFLQQLAEWADDHLGTQAAINDAVMAAAIRLVGSSSAAAVAEAVEANSAPGTIAYAENISSVATAGNALLPIEGTVILVPESDRDVVLEWGCFIANTGSTFPARGPFYCIVYEITDGIPVATTSSMTHHSLGINYITASFAAQTGSFRVGPADHDRVFALYAQAVTESGVGTLAYAVRNIPTGRTFLRAVA